MPETVPVDSPAEPEVLEGIPVYAGTAYGLCLTFSSGDLDVPQFSIEKTDIRGEAQRLRAAISTVAKQLNTLAEDSEDLPAEITAFAEIHRAILTDPALVESTVEIIRERLINAEWALSVRLERTRREFECIEDNYLRERVRDIEHVISRVQRVMTGRRSPASLLNTDGIDEKFILIADQLDPTDMLQLRTRDDMDLAGLVLEEGSTTSHAAILARSLEIPTLVGVRNAREILQDEQAVLLDADHGRIELNPGSDRRKEARLRMKELAETKKALKKIREFNAVTLDGHTVRLCANINLPEDVRNARKAGADGIGLFRTEFLFLNRDDLPGEDEQYEAYARVIRSMRGQPVVFRTADLGGDKALSDTVLSNLTGDHAPEEFNPSLGLRGLRFSFTYRDIFLTQLRALLRAAAGHTDTVHILLPMVTGPEDIREVRACLAEADAELTNCSIRHASDIKLGGMIEVPAAVLVLSELIPLLDFFSLGTNDLAQYLLAADRTNAAVSGYYDECHPAVLRLVALTIRRVLQAGKPISVCGEMAGRKELLPFFLGLGCRELSMTLTQIPAVKHRILKTDLAHAEEFAKNVLRRRSVQSVREFIRKEENLFSEHPTTE